ncbi:MAG: TonB-dependent receptor [Saprospiraceae bacterium]
MQTKHFLQLLFFLLFVFSDFPLFAKNTGERSLPYLEEESYSISGYVKDAATGEMLIQATVYNKANPVAGVTTNNYGFYSLRLPKGEYTIVFSYIGYITQELEVNLIEDQRLNVEMQAGVQFQEVVVTATDENEQVQSADMGRVELSMSQVEKLPALMGEVDILKTLQLLPGVLSASEGNTGFYVRGGGPDQNLILLDEALVYNTGHMLGFFSVFNSSAISKTKLIKGNIPARYGGRLSSVVDIQMKEGNNKTFAGEASIGLISSKLLLEGPIQKDKSSFIIAARRTYGFDLAQPFLRETAFEGTNYYFYDINAKANYRFSDKDQIYWTTYIGRDVLKFNAVDRGFSFNLPYGNSMSTLRWNHLFNDKLFMNTTLIANFYDFTFEGEQAEFEVEAYSGVRDYSAKISFDYFPKQGHAVKFGGESTWHRLTPNIVNATSGDTEFGNSLQPKYGLESGLYIEDEWTINNEWTVNGGLRASTFTLFGPFSDQATGKEYDYGDPVVTYGGLEPRLSAKYSWQKNSSVKAAWVLTRQYLHLVSNSSTTLPTDVWVPSSPLVKPQLGWQAMAGWFHNFLNGRYEMSVEVYYKDLRNQIDYGENVVPDPSVEVENDFIFGTGQSYGAEFFIKKSKGAVTGWIGYTWSKTERFFDDINDGKAYPQRYDRRHDLSFVMSYDINRKWDLGMIFVYGTGNAYTPIESVFFIEQNLNIRYGSRNSARIDPYHRMDLSATYTPTKKKKKRYETNWVFSVYNLYNRQNPAFVFPVFNTNFETGSFQAEAYKISLFPVIPSVSWKVKFKGKS